MFYFQIGKIGKLLDIDFIICYNVPMIDFAELIKTERKAHGLNRRDFARLVGVSDGAVGMWEAGHSRPSYAVMVLVSRNSKNSPWVRDLFSRILDAAVTADTAA